MFSAVYKGAVIENCLISRKVIFLKMFAQGIYRINYGHFFDNFDGGLCVRVKSVDSPFVS